jgi:hypothetical protein
VRFFDVYNEKSGRERKREKREREKERKAFAMRFFMGFFGFVLRGEVGSDREN